MDNLEKNKQIIESLKNSSELFKDLQITDNTLVFRGLTINLNNVDLEPILKNMTEITPDNLLNALKNIDTKKDNIAKWELVKKENPDMKKITVFDNHNIELNKKEEFINIRTSDGQNHLFKNVIGLDIFNEYMQLKAIYGDSISPEILAKSIERWQLNELAIEPAEKVIANPNINENIKNQLQAYIEMYKEDKNIEIKANTDEDIIYINDTTNPENNHIITFTKDINNNLVAVEHKNNVSSETTTKEDVSGNNPENQVQETVQNDNISNSVNNANNLSYQNTQTVLSDNEFTYIISKGNITANDYERINKYLENVQVMITNNDPNTDTKLKIIEESITNLQLLKDNLSPDEQALVEKCNAICDEINKSKGLDKGQVLTYSNPNRIIPNEDDNSAGYLNIVSIFVTVSVVLIGLSILVLYIINGL